MRAGIATMLWVAGSLHAAILSDFDGSWRLDKARSADVTAAIDAWLSKSNFAVRAMARPRLLKANLPAESLSIATSPTEVNVAAGTRSLASRPDGKPVVRTDKSGKELRVAHALNEGKLVQTAQTEHGTRIRTFALAPDRSSLTMDVRVQSPRLPDPLVYRLVYTPRR